MPQYTPEEMAQRADFYLNKKGLKDRAQVVKDKQEAFEKAAKKYGVTQEQFQRGIFPDEVKELYEDYAKHDIFLRRAVQWNIENDAKEAGGYDKSGEALENEFNGYVATKETTAEQLKKIKEVEDNYNKYQDRDSLTNYVKTTIEAKGATPEERIENEVQERHDQVQGAMDRLRDITKENEARTKADKIMKVNDYKESREAIEKEALADKRLMHSNIPPTRKDNFTIEVEQRTNQILKERGYNVIQED